MSSSSSSSTQHVPSNNSSTQELLDRLTSLNMVTPPKPLPEREFKIWQKKLSDISSSLVDSSSSSSNCRNLRSEIASAMCFAIDHCAYSFHLIEMLVASIDPIETANRIRHVIWKLNSSSSTSSALQSAHNHQLPQQQQQQQQQHIPDDEIKKAKDEIRSQCGKMLSRLFLLSDIFMNSVTAKLEEEKEEDEVSQTARRERRRDDDVNYGPSLNSHETTRPRPSDLAKIIEIFLDVALAQQLSEFLVVTKRREIHDQEQQQKDGDSASHSPSLPTLYPSITIKFQKRMQNGDQEEDPISQVVGWLREMWAMWKFSNLFSSSKVVKRIEDKFGFLLVTPMKK